MPGGQKARSKRRTHLFRRPLSSPSMTRWRLRANGSVNCTDPDVSSPSGRVRVAQSAWWAPRRVGPRPRHPAASARLQVRPRRHKTPAPSASGYQLRTGPPLGSSRRTRRGGGLRALSGARHAMDDRAGLTWKSCACGAGWVSGGEGQREGRKKAGHHPQLDACHDRPAPPGISARGKNSQLDQRAGRDAGR